MKTVFQKLLHLPFTVRLYVILSLSFLLIALILGVFQRYFQSNYLRAISAQNQGFVAQVDVTNHYTEGFLQDIANQVFYSRTVDKLRSYDTLTNAQLIDGLRELNSITASSTIIDSIYVYNGQQDYIYSTASYGAVSDTAETFADQAAVELLSNRTGDQRMIFFPRYSYVDDHYSEDRVYSIMFYELGTEGDLPDNAIMFNLNTDWIIGQFFGADNGDQSFIVDSNGTLVALQNDVKYDFAAELTDGVMEHCRSGNEDSYFIHELDTGEKVICFYSNMGRHDWYYVRPVNYEDCLGDLQQVEKSTFVFLALGFVTLCLTGTAASMSVYLPFRLITRRLATIEPGAEKNTEQLMTSLNRLIEGNSDAESIRHSLEGMIRGQVLKELLWGTREPDSTQLEEYNLKISPGEAVALCLISGLRVQQYLQVVQTAIPDCEGVEIMDEFSVLLLQTEQSEHALDALEQLHKRYSTTYFILGPAFKDWKLMPEIYNRMMEIYRLRFLHPKEQVVYFPELPVLDSSSSDLSEITDRIMNALKKGFHHKAIDYWQEFVCALDHKHYTAVRFGLITLGNNVLKLACADTLEGTSYNAACREYTRMLDGILTIDTLTSFFTEQFLYITTIVQQAHHLKQGNTIQEIMNACQMQLCDPGLSSQSLANQFNLSAAYLCRIFRQSNGCSLMEYVNTLRIQRAQEILCDSKTLVKDVPAQVGIENKQYFFKLFKQITGKTPKQYQNDHKAGVSAISSRANGGKTTRIYEL